MLDPPMVEKINPPTMAPTSPSAMLMKQPSPCLLTILLATKPLISPKNIQPNIDIHRSCGRTTSQDGERFAMAQDALVGEPNLCQGSRQGVVDETGQIGGECFLLDIRQIVRRFGP